MTIPTDGRIDLDALAELAERLRREAQAFDNDLGSDPEADAGTASLLREAAGAIDIFRRAAIPSEQGEAVGVPSGWQPGERELALRWMRGLLARLSSKPDHADDCLWLERLYARLSASPSPPALDGTGRDAVIEECARVAAQYGVIWGRTRDDAGPIRVGASSEIEHAIRSIKETP